MNTLALPQQRVTSAMHACAEMFWLAPFSSPGVWTDARLNPYSHMPPVTWSEKSSLGKRALARGHPKGGTR